MTDEKGSLTHFDKVSKRFVTMLLSPVWNKILASADPLLLDKETGAMKTTGGDIIAKAM